MKRTTSLLLALLLALGCLSPALALEPPMTQFTDVAPDAWYAPYVEICVREGLLNGTGDGKFDPDGPVNEDEAIVMAARVLWHADGGEGPLPQGPTPEEMIRRMGDDAEYWFQYGVDDAQWASELWSWDGLCYLILRAREEGFDLPLYHTTYPATRSDFFHALAFAAQGLELSAVNEIDQVPGARARDEDLLRLYRAGILAGTDEYGSFRGRQTLTRAEAAAALARLFHPELRLSFRPEPMDYPYTLTYLMDGSSDIAMYYPVCPTSAGILTLDGALHDLPGRVAYASGLQRSQDYLRIICWNDDTEDPWDQRQGLMDKNGRMVIPLGVYDHVAATRDGHFLGINTGAAGWNQCFLLSSDGQVEAELPGYFGTPTNTWDGFNEGLCPWWDEASELVGYVDAQENWVVEPVFFSAGSFQNGYAVVRDQAHRTGLMDRRGEMVIPFGDYTSLVPFRNSPDYKGPEGLIWFDGPNGSGWMDLEGNRYPAGTTDGSFNAFQNGYSIHDGVYYDVHLAPVSEPFDWAGAITADGQGFVGLNGKIYRIDFAQ